MDRTPEEKRRGMTIELGVARLEAGEGPDRFGGAASTLDLIDVPGHEALVHTMVRGAAGVDLGLLVVAADDGVMPQTREHLAVLQLLEVPALIAVLTKIGAVEAELADIAEAELVETLGATPWRDAGVLRVDSLTRQGVPEVARALLEASGSTRARATHAPFRLPVDRVFSIPGRGTVITGTVVSGAVKVGDPLVLLPGDRPVKVRELQRHGVADKTAYAGDRVALNVPSLSQEDVSRGSVVVSAGAVRAVHRFDTRVSLLPDVRHVLKDGDRIRVHVLTSRAVARVRLLDAARVGAGETALAQLTCEDPPCVLPKDRFVLRSLSPAWTVGGGSVLECGTKRARRGDMRRIERLVALERAAPAEAVAGLLEGAALGATLEELASLAGLPNETVRTAVAALAQDGRALEVAGRWLRPQARAAVMDRVLGHIEALQRREPLKRAFGRETVRTGCGIDAALVDAALEVHAAAGLLTLDASSVALARRPDVVDRKTRAAIDAARSFVVHVGRKPVRMAELGDRFKGWPTGQLKRVVDHLVDEGALKRLRGTGEGSGALIATERLEEARGIVQGLCDRPSGASLPEIRDALGLGRHPAQWLAEHFDAEGMTLLADGRRRTATSHRDIRTVSPSSSTS